MPRRHAGVTTRLGIAFETVLLTLTRPRNPFANQVGTFLDTLTRHIPIFNRRNFNVQIDAIEQRTGNALTVTMHLHRTATTFAFQIAKVSAGTRIHRCYEHELGWKCEAAGGA